MTEPVTPGNRSAMLNRLEQYARLRTVMRSPDAARELGISDRTRERYERWYRRERLHLPDRPRGLPNWKRGGNW